MAKKYSELRKMSQADRDANDVDLEIEDTKLQLQGDKLATTREINKKNKELAALKSGYPLDTTNIIALSAKINALEDGLKALEKLEAELF